MNNGKSELPIVPKKLLITVEGRGIHFIVPDGTEHTDRRAE